MNTMQTSDLALPNSNYPLDIWDDIFQRCDLLSQLNLFAVCSDFYRSFSITDLYNIPEKYRNRLTILVLRQTKFGRLVQLNVGGNKHVTDVSFLTALKNLNVNGQCGVDQQGIKGLNLRVLYAAGNEKNKGCLIHVQPRKIRCKRSVWS